MEYFTAENQPVNLADPLGRGGEAIVYNVADRPHRVAKIYHEPTIERTAKLQAMLARPPQQPDSHLAIVWPTELLYQADTVVGFLMPKITGYEPIFSVYNPAMRRQTYPNFTWQHLHRVAYNLCEVVASIHVKEHVIGDLNESNLLVDPRGLVAAVDTDSFQISAHDGSIYRCKVGKGEYTPPELQGANLKQVTRLPYHDDFGLAVLLFQLLMQGYHPFAGVLESGLSVGKIDLYAIREGLFPYSDDTTMRPPPAAPSFNILHPELQAAFGRCFVEGYQNPQRRPTAREWLSLLAQADQALMVCSAQADHIYSNHLSTCPWCDPLPVSHPVEVASAETEPPQPIASPQPTWLSPRWLMAAISSAFLALLSTLSKMLTNVLQFVLIAVVLVVVMALLTPVLEYLINNNWSLAAPTPKPSLDCAPDCRGADLSGRDLSGFDLQRVDLSEANLSGANLSSTNLNQADLSQANLAKTNLEWANLSGADLTAANLSEASLFRTTLRQAILDQTILKQAVFERANLLQANLVGADLTEARFGFRTNLGEANFREAVLHQTTFFQVTVYQTDFRRADLRGANLKWVDFRELLVDDATQLDDNWRAVWEVVTQGGHGRDLRGLDLSGANLEGADLQGANLEGVDLFNAILQNINLSQANLRRANLRSALMEGANLSGADLRETNPQSYLVDGAATINFSGANLSGLDLSNINFGRQTDLSHADLSGSNLQRATLPNANLRQANLTEADFTGANLTNADFSEASMDGAIFDKK